MLLFAAFQKFGYIKNNVQFIFGVCSVGSGNSCTEGLELWRIISQLADQHGIVLPWLVSADKVERMLLCTEEDSRVGIFPPKPASDHGKISNIFACRGNYTGCAEHLAEVHQMIQHAVLCMWLLCLETE